MQRGSRRMETGLTQRFACTACRQLKTRCLDNDDQSVPCRRCRKFNVTCVYTRKKRGRKARNERDRSSASPDRASHTSLPDLTLTYVDSQYHSSHLLQSPSASRDNHAAGPSNFALPPTQHDSTRLSNVRTVQGDEYSPSTSSVLEPRLAPGRAVADYLDPEDADRRTQNDNHLNTSTAADTSTGVRGRVTIASHEDPVSLGFLSLMESQSMVDYFFQHLNPLIGLLDPQLHDIDYIRSHSAVLFTAILSATSTFTRRDLRTQLLNHNQALLNRAMASATCDVGVVQGIIISVYWKAPSDRSSWLKIGWAIRMGYQMKWHLHWRVDLPTDEHMIRLLLNPERTWFCLWCLERSHSRTFDLPPSIQPDHIGDIMLWIANHPQLDIGSDWHLAVSIEYERIFERSSHSLRQLTLRGQLRWLRSIKNLPRESYHPFIADIEARQRKINDKWYGKGNLPRAHGLSQNEVRALYWLSLEPKLEILRMELDLASSQSQVEDIIQRGLITITDIVGELESLGRDGLLKHLFDFASCALSTLTLFVRDIFSRLPSPQKLHAVNLLKSVHRVSTAAADGDPEMATAFIARFVRRVLRTISHESRPASRATSPTTNAGQILGGVDGLVHGSVPDNVVIEPFLADLDVFFQQQPSQADATNLDGEYWTSLFATGAEYDLLGL